MDANQLGRRNLTADQRSYLRGRMYTRAKKAAHGRDGRTFGDAKVASPKTADALSERFHVSPRTIDRDAKRYEAIEKLAETAPEERTASFWMDSNQLGRRNLTADQRSYLRGRVHSRTEKRQGQRTDLTCGQSVHKLKTAETIAAKYGVSERTIRRDAKRYEAIEKLAETAPEEAQAVRWSVVTSARRNAP